MKIDSETYQQAKISTFARLYGQGEYDADDPWIVTIPMVQGREQSEEDSGEIRTR